MGALKKLKNDATLFAHSLFRGMASADSVIQSQSNGGGEESEITQQVRTGGVLADMLEEKQTQRMIEMRDKYYRVLREADKYDASHLEMTEHEIINEKGEKETVVDFDISNGIRKKTKSDFMKHPPVYEESGTTLRTIQDNKRMYKHNGLLGPDTIGPGEDYFTEDFDTTLTIERGDFIPRFELEKYVTRIAVRNIDGTDKAYVDMYTATEASQFGKIDAIFIANINQIMESKNLRSDITDLKGIEWYSDKAWNSEDVVLFKYDDVHFKGINVFDGSFVLTFECHIVNDGLDLAEKYKTKELDEKYASEAPKRDNIDMFTIQRHMERMKNKEKEEPKSESTDLNDIMEALNEK